MLYRSMCLPSFFAFYVSAVAGALLLCCLVIRTHVSLPMFHLKVHWAQRTLGKYAALSVGVDQVGNLVLFPLLPTRLEIWSSRGMCLDLSSGMKVNDFADLTTSEFVSEYTGYKPNSVWSGREHLETHEYVHGPLDQVKPGSCFQSSDEGPSLFFFVV